MMSIDVQRRHSLWPLAALIVGIAAAIFPAAAAYARSYALPLSSVLGVYSCFIGLLFCAIAPAVTAGRASLERLIGGRLRALKLCLLLTLPYLCYAAGTGANPWRGVLRLVAITAPVVIVYSAFPVRQEARFSIQDLFAAVWLVSIVLFRLFRGIWNRPADLDFMARLFVLSLGALCWTYIRCVPDLQYRFVFSRRAFLAAAKNFVIFAAIAIPLGMAIRFTAWNPRWRGALDFATGYLELLIFIALLEELFFRGFLQNLLEKSLHSTLRGQVVASCVFGFFHILHKPFPNWRYVLLASIAGWFYGSAYREGGTVFASAFLHAMVDEVWRTFFTRG
jgi:membrane protease YdiL (CAAX protease family)